MNHPLGMANPAELPWWLDEGEEQCDGCLQTYVYEVEVRCVDCDGPSCPHCAVVVREQRTVYRCPGCAAAAGEDL